MARCSVLLALLALATVIPSASAAQATQARPAATRTSLDARVRALLSGFEDGPTQAEIAALGDDGLSALIRLHDDTSEVGAIRLRAITCAGWIPGTRARAFLVGLLHQDGLDALHLRAALRALAAREGASALAEIVRHGDHADPAVREAVFLSLISIRAQASAAARAEVDGALARLLASEPDAELVRATRARLDAR